MKRQHNFSVEIIAIVALAVVIPVLIDKLIFGNNIYSNISNEAWAGFLGGFLGGILTLFSVIYTIHANDKRMEEEVRRREREKAEAEKKNHRVLIDVLFTMGTVEELDKTQDPDKTRYLYLCKDEKEPTENQKTTFIQIINRSAFLVKDVNVLINTVNRKGDKHQYISEIPYIGTEYSTIVVLPHIIDVKNCRHIPVDGKDDSREMTETIVIDYLTLSNEK